MLIGQNTETRLSVDVGHHHFLFNVYLPIDYKFTIFLYACVVEGESRQTVG